MKRAFAGVVLGSLTLVMLTTTAAAAPIGPYCFSSAPGGTFEWYFEPAGDGVFVITGKIDYGVEGVHPMVASGFIDQNNFKVGYTSQVIGTGFLVSGWALISLQTLSGSGRQCRVGVDCFNFTIGLVPCNP